MESVYFWVILAFLIVVFFMGIAMSIYALYIGSMLVRVAELLEEVRGVAAEVRYIQMAKLRRGRPPGDPSGLVDLDSTNLSYDYDPRVVPPPENL